MGSVFGPLLYLLNTANLPVSLETTTPTYADDTSIPAPHQKYDVAVENLQHAANAVEEWAQQWKIKINSTKSTRVDFSLRKHEYILTILGHQLIPLANSAKYLGIHLEEKFKWRRQNWNSVSANSTGFCMLETTLLLKIDDSYISLGPSVGPCCTLVLTAPTTNLTEHQST